MPYRIEENDKGEFCVYKESGGETLGCHPTKAEAESQIQAIYAHESKEQKLRRAIIITSNAYRDREGEIVKEKALRDHVERQWKDGEFTGREPLLFWHGGDAIGEIVYADMMGAFLIEIAQERPDTAINVARKAGDEPMPTTVKELWDSLARSTEELGASHQFIYEKGDREDSEYEAIVKTETSVLPRSAAANRYTFFYILEE